MINESCVNLRLDYLTSILCGSDRKSKILESFVECHGFSVASFGSNTSASLSNREATTWPARTCLRPKVASKDKIPIEIKDFEINRNAKFVK